MVKHIILWTLNPELSENEKKEVSWLLHGQIEEILKRRTLHCQTSFTIVVSPHHMLRETVESTASRCKGQQSIKMLTEIAWF